MRIATRTGLALMLAAIVVTGWPVSAADQTPASALERLKEGNARFAANAAVDLPVDEAKRQALTKGQSPFAIILSCADSRVPPEIIFNVGLGEIFIVRTAGQVTDKAVLASIEYAAEHLNVPLLVVMGHDSCGAVKATVETKPGAPSLGPNLDALVGAIRPAFDRMANPADLEHLREATLANVEQVVNNVLEQSAIVSHLASAGKIQIIGAFYELETGRVRFSQPVPTSAIPAAKRAGAGHGSASPAHK